MQEEIWKDVVGYEELFRVSNFGNVFSKRTGKLLKQHSRKHGRKTIATKVGGRNGMSLCFKVHRLVAEAFLENIENKPQVNHIDGNPSNNNLVNLEWATASENIVHAFDNGLIKIKSGLENALFKLTYDQVLFIKEKYREYCRVFGARALGRMFGVTHGVITDAYKLDI